VRDKYYINALVIRGQLAILQTGGKKGDWLLSFAGILILYGVTGVIRNQQRVS